MKGKIALACLFGLMLFSGCVGEPSEDQSVAELQAMWIYSGMDIKNTSASDPSFAGNVSEADIRSLKAEFAEKKSSYPAESVGAALAGVYESYCDFLIQEKVVNAVVEENAQLSGEEICDNLDLSESQITKMNNLLLFAGSMSSEISSFNSSFPTEAASANLQKDVPDTATMEENIREAQESFSSLEELCSSDTDGEEPDTNPPEAEEDSEADWEEVGQDATVAEDSDEEPEGAP